MELLRIVCRPSFASVIGPTHKSRKCH